MTSNNYIINKTRLADIQYVYIALEKNELLP